MTKIKYNIDEIIIKKEIYVRGWIFSTSGEKITFVDEKKNIIELKKTDRVDVFECYKNHENALKSGIEMKLPLKKVILTATDGESEVNIKINPYEIKLNKKLNQIKQYMKLINCNNIKRIIYSTKNNGVIGTYYKIKNFTKNNEVNYMKWFENHMPSKKELKEQKKVKFNYKPKISIVTPVWNTPENFLIEMIESVREQTYSNWELCLADGASTNQKTIEILKKYEELDNRIKVKYLDKNYMISGNTNEALTLATGEFIGLFDHDDLLTPNCLYEVVKILNEDREIEFIYTDEDKTDENTKEFFDPHFKQDWAPYTLRSYNYITHFSVFSKNLLNKVGNFRSEYDGSQDYDIILRLTEKAKKIYHIPKILYHWRVHKNSVASGGAAKPYAYIAAKKALNSHLNRLNIEGEAISGLFQGSYKINYEIKNEPKISIVIPNKDYKKDLKKCIDSILKKSTYKNYEIIVIENNSVSKEIFEYYTELEKNSKIKILKLEMSEFNYSYVNNKGIEKADGEYIILLNNDTEIITPQWMEEMIMLCQQKDVGVVGAKLYYPDNTIQHAGIVVGIVGTAAHIYSGEPKLINGHIGRLKVIQNMSAVTGACLMIRKDVFAEVNGLDEELFKVAYNDVDLCLKVIKKGYYVLWTPFAELYHYESKSRGSEDTSKKQERFRNEILNFKEKWSNYIFEGDPYYNKNLTLNKDDFSLRE